jgi:excisionase family DNA binding protein
MAQRYLCAREIAELLGRSERTIRRWIRDGTLPSCRIGGARLVSLVHLELALRPHKGLAGNIDEPESGDQS